MNEHRSHPPALEADLVAGLRNIRHGFFTRKGGVSEGIYASLNCGPGSSDDGNAVAENRRRATEALKADRLATVYQVHGTDVVTVDERWTPDNPPKADGLATDLPGIALGILTADCAPVLLADEDASVVGACHAGWRGALDGVTDATIAAMEKLGARRDRIAAAIGPCIAQKSYQVGGEFRDIFLNSASENSRYFQPDDADRFRFDLPGYVTARLQAAKLGAVTWIGGDTYTDADSLFSYRRSTHRGEEDYGRALSAIMLSPGRED